MNKCPFCDSKLVAIPSRLAPVYAGGCINERCPVVFRTKDMYDKLEAVMTIVDIAKKVERKKPITLRFPELKK